MKLKPLSVTHVNSYIKKLILNDPILYNVRVKGEISNFKVHSSKNMYFSLKDDNSKLRCIMFSENAIEYENTLKEGMNVVANGYISIYERDGAVQLYVKSIEMEGMGQLYADFLKLKDKLQSEGLFAEAKKKTIPQYPGSIGVITSETGAAVRDIINIVKRRFPKVSIKIYPALVQGENSAKQLIKGIQLFNEISNIDVIIIGRGGGSIEELWSFNDENLAREIAKSKIPVISAVGHETDYTISDFVSDLRAPTPSAAAELCVPSLLDMEYRLEHIKNKMTKDIKARLEKKGIALENIAGKRPLRSPEMIYDKKKVDLDYILEKMGKKMSANMDGRIRTIEMTGRNLFNLNPLSILSRGYSVAQKEGKTLKSADDVVEGQVINVMLSDGTLECSVDKICKGMIDYEKDEL
ncbi:Exodeoxyribonuclease VII large subunit [Peptoclostridium litorale DSM 5388]|uniref:Exodeoxyribonuclease 7 large subunit n=1 Tax=Peptoclostridium litorale DSM 5388 TaxID=1121324 RepID=A0A069RAP6_PEPLI|nr:exodeoxyribonuclease VII large subunit [Peptoclostridium litorale]KDR94109.1 exodeoxyribonuclease 7 large subunit XseA [Peptoclostridium litorale DSM 5388]SIN80977.1 Exodeoxyribonuclease VII large subunit [Peptoclostridium litorale DSM 5388]